MRVKLLEIRDRATFFPALAVDMNVGGEAVGNEIEARRYLLRRLGYACDGRPTILFTHAGGGHRAHTDPYYWADRTFKVAHDYVEKNWDALADGDVVDVEYILGETTVKKVSERLTSSP